MPSDLMEKADLDVTAHMLHWLKTLPVERRMGGKVTVSDGRMG